MNGLVTVLGEALRQCHAVRTVDAECNGALADGEPFVAGDGAADHDRPRHDARKLVHSKVASATPDA
jgi:hypothetical protein